MKKTKPIHRYLVSLMAIFLVLGQFNLATINAFAKENGNEELSYEVKSELAADKKSADLSLKVTPTNEQIKILTIETPDGKKTEGQEASYKAEKNGNTDFLVTYKNTNTEKAETKTYTASYDVSGIVSESTSKTTDTETNNKTTSANTTKAETKTLLGAGESNVTLSIPDYDQTAWGNGDIKEVTATVEFGDSTSTEKKVNFTLPDGMRFVSVPVPSNYKAGENVDSGVLSYLGASDPLSVAITSTTVPDMETTYNKATFGTVSYDLDKGTEKASFTFSVRVDAAKYYGATDLKSPIKAEAFVNGDSTPIDTAEQTIHAEGNKVVGYAKQDHVKTMFRNWYDSSWLKEVTASTASYDSYNYTKPYSVVNALNQPDSRGARVFMPKHVTTTIYYPAGMEFVGVADSNGNLSPSNANKTITNYPEENKVVIEFNQLNYNGVNDTVFSVKYKVPEGTPAGTYEAAKAPHAVITTYDGEVFESDALTKDTTDLTTVADIDTCVVVDPGENKMNLIANDGSLNPDNETWAGSIRIDNKHIAGVKTDQMYQIEFDPNWEAYMVNLPFDSTMPDNQITGVLYKTNLDSNYRPYTGALTKNNNQSYRLDAQAVGLKDGEYFTVVRANVGAFSPGYISSEGSAIYRWNSTSSYGKAKPGITSVKFTGSVWATGHQDTTKSTGVSTYSVPDETTSAADGTATFYNEDGTAIQTARAGETINTKATLLLNDYPFGTTTVINNPDVYLHELDGTTIKPSSIKLTDQDGKDVDFSVHQETASNGDKVYVLKTTNTTVGEFVGYPTKEKYLNLSYDTVFDVTLDKTFSMDAQNVIAWGGSDVASAVSYNSFNDTGLDVNQNGIDDEKLLSVQTSLLNVSKQDTVVVQTFLSLAGEGAKDAYVEGEDSTVSYFTPGTDADYTVQITNTASSAANTFELYIPIPKTGQNFGPQFQEEAFNWDMKLSGALPLTTDQQAQFEVGYATAATADDYESAGLYTDSVSDFSKVNMVRIKVKTQINAGETQTFKVPLNVDETFDSATTGNKIGERDVYNPYYRVVTNTFSGTLSGTKVGAELVIGEVSGTVFNDTDANGLYEKTKGDKPLAGETVELYKWNDATSSYEPATKDGNNVTSKTDANGAYKFDYTSGVGYGKYAVKFPDKAGYQYTLNNVGNDTSLDSDVSYSGADKGWVKEIDSTQPESQYINAGYYAYTPDQDLKVNLNEKLVQAGNSLEITLPKVASTSGQAAEDTIEPAFFNNIQASSDGYKWTVADTDVATVKTLSDGSAAVVGVSAGDKTIAATDLTIAIQDVFGTTQSSTAPVYVTAPNGTVTQKDGYTVGATDFSMTYKDSVALTEAQSMNLGKTAAFEEVKSGVNSSAEDRTSLVKVDQTQLDAIKNGPNTGGTYPLTYTVTKDGKTAEVTIQVTVAADLTSIDAHDSTIYAGDTWTAEDNFDSALNKAGDTVPFADVTVSGTVNTDVAGTYPVTYSYNGVSKTINVTVKDKQSAINAHNSTIYTGDTWTAEDNFDSALDKDGNSIDFADITVSGTVDTTKVGENDITYTHDGVSTTITVTVKENKEGISAHDSSIYVGDTWTAEDNFDSAFDKDGNSVTFDDVTVTEKPTVDNNKVGAYEVTYTYGKESKTITVTVKDIQTAVNAHDSTIYINDSWSAEGNFDSALDKDGNKVAFADVEVSGTVDTDKAGVYPVTYTYDGVSTTINVTVKDSLTAVTAHDSVIYAGDKWSAEDNFDNATDKDGNKIDFKDITVTDATKVDANTPGVYQVTYSYDGVSTTINVTVEPRQTIVDAHDSTIYAGDKWSAEDNFDSAKNKKGDNVKFADVTVTGQVDPDTAGIYEVSYSYDGVKTVVHVTVLENKAQITVKDSVIQKGDKWSAEDNFINATNRDGVAIPFSKVTTSGTVNTDKVGTYKVIYTYDPNEGTKDAGKELLSVTATIRVEAANVSPAKPNDPSKPSGKSFIKINDNTQKTHKATYLEAKPLPKTGDQTNPWTVWTGVALLGLSMLLWAATRRKRHQ
ncbi:LPXTG cell wall anchor domain-containing protein [Listeria seeligeri]|uniref:bacterial Ig-like domain-containing protein n=1 Tax=Listeria seeligeri TaxID=1640 RepID=UPI001627126D|nr:bacterial Ig-like domain-containing protein [Listeria seeligeri]MBC1870113.1 LPXTG cell wall anchor domain-containing protein [Listeria seeligeri]MBC1875965.1 LPXTG cell wall anchor domain-containing protein [Listeria seeligeri]MBC6131887.1 LPXTG cell wall anchor domain-containing protein [Listeria seeligeri]MBF2553073.1 bacterial Ig-like domain-containing protein [Listeria seeligeri]MBF2644835.1 bacterial Ig-like domain-containing protein [Listeria seeligeri]